MFWPPCLGRLSQSSITRVVFPRQFISPKFLCTLFTLYLYGTSLIPNYHLSNTYNRVFKLPRSLHDHFTTCNTRTTLLLCPLPSLSYSLIVSRYRLLPASLSPCALFTCDPSIRRPLYLQTSNKTRPFTTT
jgi:hypothetical protein